MARSRRSETQREGSVMKAVVLILGQPVTLRIDRVTTEAGTTVLWLGDDRLLIPPEYVTAITEISQTTKTKHTRP